MKLSDRVRIDSVAQAVAMGGCVVLAFLAAELERLLTNGFGITRRRCTWPAAEVLEAQRGLTR